MIYEQFFIPDPVQENNIWEWETERSYDLFFHKNCIENLIKEAKTSYFEEIENGYIEKTNTTNKPIFVYKLFKGKRVPDEAFVFYF